MVSFLLGACGESDSPTLSTAETEVIEQTTEERTYEDWALEEAPLAESPSIGDIEQLRIFNDRMFVYDLAYMNIKRYTLNGELEAVYGNGRGQGPGEFQNIFSFWVRDKEAVWIVDSQAQEVSQFQYDGTFVESFHPEFPPMRVVALNKDQLVVQMFARPKLFALVNEEGEVQNRFGEMKDDLHTSSFDAHMFPRPTGGFIWAPIYASSLFFYDADAELERRMELIDSHPFPTDQTDSDPMQVPDDPPQRTMSVSVTDETIFVTTLLRNAEPPTSVLDRYDRESGQYLGSVRMPSDGYQYLVHDGMIYGEVADTTVQAFHLPQ